jgi:protein SCO1
MTPQSHRRLCSHVRCPTGPLMPERAEGRHSVLVRWAALTGIALLVLAASGGATNAAEAASAPAHASHGPIKSIREYSVPAVRLVRDDGKTVSLPDEMNDGRPIVLNFIFTSCGDICPLMSSVF